MKIILEIDKSDLKAMYDAYICLRRTGFEPQDYKLQLQLAAEEKRITQAVQAVLTKQGGE